MNIDYLAKLARLDLSRKEKQKLASQLQAILDFVEKLKEADTADVEPTSQATGLENVMRSDGARPTSEAGRQKILANAPQTKDGYIKVKAVFE